MTFLGDLTVYSVVFSTDYSSFSPTLESVRVFSSPAAVSLCVTPQLQNNSALAVDFRAQLASHRLPRPQDDAAWVALLLGEPHARPTVGKNAAVADRLLENCWQSSKVERI